MKCIQKNLTKENISSFVNMKVGYLEQVMDQNLVVIPNIKNLGEYLPEIIKKEEIENLLLLPPEIKEKFVKDLKEGKI